MSGHALTVTMLGTRELVLTRTFEAPRRVLFDALTTPELLVRWYGAQGWQLVECEVDLRVGGAWRYVSRGPEGDEMTQYGVYREVDAPRRLTYTERFVDQSFPGESLITAVIEDRGTRSTLRSTVRFPSPEARDLVLSRPMERGLGEGYRRLDRVLATEAGEHHELDTGGRRGPRLGRGPVPGVLRGTARFRRRPRHPGG